jgi:hypothetical protein
MSRPTTLRRIRRLKADYAHTIAEYERRKKEWEELRRSLAVDHLLRIIVVFQYGDPRIDEPLALATHRALSKLGCLKAERVALWRVRDILEAEPPAGDIKSKISARVRQMPDWLLDLCLARLSMILIGAPPLPKSASELKPSISDIKAWPFLPKGVLVPRRSERSFLDEMSFEELDLHFDIIQRPEQQRTRHERRFLDEVLARGAGIRVFVIRALEKQQQHATDNRDDGAGE